MSEHLHNLAGATGEKMQWQTKGKTIPSTAGAPTRCLADVQKDHSNVVGGHGAAMMLANII